MLMDTMRGAILQIKQRQNLYNIDCIARFDKTSAELAKKILTNYIKYKGENMDTSTTSNAQVANDPGSRASQRMYTILSFFIGLARQAGIFFFGIFIGLGVVLRNPPEDKKSLEKIAILENENKVLSGKLKGLTDEEKSDKSSFGQVKESVVIKN